MQLQRGRGGGARLEAAGLLRARAKSSESGGLGVGAELSCQGWERRPGGQRPWGASRPPGGGQPCPSLQRDSSVTAGAGAEGRGPRRSGSALSALETSLEGSRVSLASSWSQSRGFASACVTVVCEVHLWTLVFLKFYKSLSRPSPTPSKIIHRLKHLAMRVFLCTRSERGCGGGTCPVAAGV